MAKNKFRAAFAKAAKEHWDEAKSAEAGDYRITLPEGDYHGLLTLELTVLDKGKMVGAPVVESVITVDAGEHEGNSSCKKGYLLSGDYAAKNFEGLVKMLKKAYPDDAADIASMDEEGIADFLEESASEPLRVSFSVITTDIAEKDAKGKEIPGKSKTIKYFAVNGPLADQDAAPPSDEDPDDAEDDAENSDGDSDEEPNDYEPSKGDLVLYKPKGEKKAREFTVKTVNRSKKTVSLEDEDGEKFTDSFDSVELAND